MVAVSITSTLLRVCCTISQIRQSSYSVKSSPIPSQNLRFTRINPWVSCRIVRHHYCCKNNIEHRYFNDDNKNSQNSRVQQKTVTMNIVGNEKVVYHHYPSVSSTQDETKRILSEDNIIPSNIIAVTASSQDSGRGTRGRTWVGVPGNLFLTIAIPLSFIPIPITLLPLKIGTIVANQISKFIRVRNESSSANDKVTVKWPNDILIEDLKISGTLIEMHNDFFLVGIGCNIIDAPQINSTGPQRGRKATYLNKYIISSSESSSAQELATMIVNDITYWIQHSKLNHNTNKAVQIEKVINDWSALFEFGKPYILRDEPDNEVVLPIGIELDGRLKVVSEKNGEERLLVADYLF